MPTVLTTLPQLQQFSSTASVTFTGSDQRTTLDHSFTHTSTSQYVASQEIAIVAGTSVKVELPGFNYILTVYATSDEGSFQLKFEDFIVSDPTPASSVILYDFSRTFETQGAAETGLQVDPAEIYLQAGSTDVRVRLTVVGRVTPIQEDSINYPGLL